MQPFSCDSTPPQSLSAQTVLISRSDRWIAHRRFQELEIPSQCSQDGYLQVIVSSPSQALQVWSVIQRLLGSRQRQVTWLKECWQQAELPDLGEL